ncbi:MAG: dTDP-4-dehydrorhamnose 3,5-epimerase [Desulfobacterales bacterium]|nr:dTDP-4-dehydrorhamnose 3,5-epimerase [Desulfobacterales bacterium]
MNLRPAPLDGVWVVEPEVFQDDRGFFVEIFHRERYARSGINRIFVQDNVSFSVRNTLRGLHYQRTQAQAKLVGVITGEIYDVCVDIRPGSPTFGQWFGIHLSGQNKHQIFIPEGFAHGFCVLSDSAHVLYKCSALYAPGDEGGILWSDPGLGINWPVKNPILSEKDRTYPCLSDLPPDKLPQTGRKS